MPFTQLAAEFMKPGRHLQNWHRTAGKIQQHARLPGWSQGDARWRACGPSNSSCVRMLRVWRQLECHALVRIEVLPSKHIWEDPGLSWHLHHCLLASHLCMGPAGFSKLALNHPAQGPSTLQLV